MSTSDHCPLTRSEIRELLDEANELAMKRDADPKNNENGRGLAEIQIRLMQAIPGSVSTIRIKRVDPIGKQRKQLCDLFHQGYLVPSGSRKDPFEGICKLLGV